MKKMFGFIGVKTRVNKPPTPNQLAMKMFGEKLNDLPIPKRDKILREYQNKRKAYLTRVKELNSMVSFLQGVEMGITHGKQISKIVKITTERINTASKRATQVNPFKSYSSGKSSTIGAHGIR